MSPSTDASTTIPTSDARASDGSPTGAVRLDSVSKVFGRGPQALLALDRVSLSVGPGGFVALVGASGCGKSTLAGEITVRLRHEVRRHGTAH